MDKEFKNLFYDCRYLVSVYFTKNVQTGHIKSLSYMFSVIASALPLTPGNIANIPIIILLIKIIINSPI